MATMTMETAAEWLKHNMHDLKRLADIGELRAVAALNAWREAKEHQNDHDRRVFYEKQRYFLDALNEFVVSELNRSNRAELRGKYDHKASDMEPADAPYRK